MTVLFHHFSGIAGNDPPLSCQLQSIIFGIRKGIKKSIKKGVCFYAATH
jgi:hypothetical protein